MIGKRPIDVYVQDMTSNKERAKWRFERNNNQPESRRIIIIADHIGGILMGRLYAIADAAYLPRTDSNL